MIKDAGALKHFSLVTKMQENGKQGTVIKSRIYPNNVKIFINPLGHVHPVGNKL